MHPGTIHRLVWGALWISALAGGMAHAQLTAIVAVEPTEKKAGNSILRSALEAGLSKASGQTVTVTTTEDLADAMRATRSGGYDIFIGPPQVAASALQRGYELVGCSQKSDHYVLVGLPQIESVGALKGKRLYLPQQDSVYSYMGRGMLNEAGLSFKDLKSVRHEKYPQAGLSALTLGTTDATVVRAEEWAQWSATFPGVAKVLATSRPVPGGFSAVVRKELPSEVRGKLSQWLSTAPSGTGLAPTGLRPDMQEYQKVAELGLFTPTSLPSVKRVSAKDVVELLGQGAVVVDTRTEKEYRAKRIRGAVWAAYGEKSLKDVAFNPEQDDFKALETLDRSKALIFSCNGAECWKSYKAAKVAADKGFRNVYWMRGGLPEWDAEGLPTEGG